MFSAVKFRCDSNGNNQISPKPLKIKKKNPKISGVVWCGMVWYGAVWLVWCGLVGVEWFGWCGVVW